MPFPEELYDPDTLAVLSRAFDDAWQEVQTAASAPSEADLSVAKAAIVLRLTLAANEGERDLERLKELARRAIKGRWS